ncbi:hypothetical protein CKM354_000679600 [Cercospora kikuchii]|uniref:Uncharacterized protein n=1 Tax=Cercospora kikuchii TaxID=84275 RepID=A0A9P3FGW2_9PEZI|nr:uncharacterized protein CKM354_000679600 [Cercospora kikuchii]GIZ43577.1 hypothetical protein CKM354_000679600 [Cercospora kikuchii]
MAGQFPWIAETPELDYATTESSGERIEELHSPPTPEAQVAGLASYPGDFVDLFAGTQYGYEPGADQEILQNDFDEEATCALHATIGFEGQQAANGAFCLPYPAQRLGFGEVQTIGATTTGHDLLATPSAIPFEDAPFVQPIESVPFNERISSARCNL